jgi:hypothetical protein
MQHHPVSLRLFAASAALTLSCSATSPGGGDLTLEATISRSVIPVGQTDTLTLRLRNLSAYPVSYRFSSSCQLVPFIEHGPTQIVYPPGAAYVCAAVLTTLTIPPGGVHLVVQEIRGVVPQAPPQAGIALAPGTYSAVAVLQPNSQTGELRSAPVTFRVE